MRTSSAAGGSVPGPGWTEKPIGQGTWIWEKPSTQPAKAHNAELAAAARNKAPRTTPPQPMPSALIPTSGQYNEKVRGLQHYYSKVRPEKEQREHPPMPSTAPMPIHRETSKPEPARQALVAHVHPPFKPANRHRWAEKIRTVVGPLLSDVERHPIHTLVRFQDLGRHLLVNWYANQNNASLDVNLSYPPKLQMQAAYFWAISQDKMEFNNIVVELSLRPDLLWEWVYHYAHISVPV